MKPCSEIDEPIAPGLRYTEEGGCFATDGHLGGYAILRGMPFGRVDAPIVVDQMTAEHADPRPKSVVEQRPFL
jgi:hypothetical protein